MKSPSADGVPPTLADQQIHQGPKATEVPSSLRPASLPTRPDTFNREVSLVLSAARSASGRETALDPSSSDENMSEVD